MAVRDAHDYEISCLLLGRTGWGKSTTGNKLIGSKEDKKYTYQPYYSKPTMLLNNTTSKITVNMLKFKEGTIGDLRSTTTNCQLIANTTLKICVLDVQGFADTEATSKVGLKEANLNIIRDILRLQIDQGITFNRILYFLPARGIPEKPDGYVQQELKVLHTYFRENIFKCMVLVFTATPLLKSRYDFHEDKKAFTRDFFVEAVKKACECELDECPPIIFIGKDDSSEEVRKKVKSARVTGSPNVKLTIPEDVCLKCACIIQRSISDDENEVKEIVIIGKSGVKIEMYDSYCHPELIPKYSILKKLMGTVVILVTVGLGYVFGFRGVLNSEEICVNCKKSPGETSGCLRVGSVYSYDKSTKIEVKHSHELPPIEYQKSKDD